MEWVAIVLASNPNAKVNTIIAIPYNPQAPEPYSRWTLKGRFDIGEEIKVAEEFWDFLGGEGTFLDLLRVFETIGAELRPGLLMKLSEFNDPNETYK